MGENENYLWVRMVMIMRMIIVSVTNNFCYENVNENCLQMRMRIVCVLVGEFLMRMRIICSWESFSTTYQIGRASCRERV